MGFEPTVPGNGTPVFETDAFSHSATSPLSGFAFVWHQYCEQVVKLAVQLFVVKYNIQILRFQGLLLLKHGIDFFGVVFRI